MAAKGRTKRVAEETPQQAFASSLERHLKDEEQALETLERLLTLPDPLVKLIGGLVLADERHHHELMRKTAKALKSDSYWFDRAMAARAIPEEAARKAQAQVEALAYAESGGAALLRTLGKVYLGNDDIAARAATMWMELDSKKHEALLRMLAEYLKASANSAREQREQVEAGAL